jgi:hypothetical protein
MKIFVHVVGFRFFKCKNFINEIILCYTKPEKEYYFGRKEMRREGTR